MILKVPKEFPNYPNIHDFDDHDTFRDDFEGAVEHLQLSKKNRRKCKKVKLEKSRKYFLIVSNSKRNLETNSNVYVSRTKFCCYKKVLLLQKSLVATKSFVAMMLQPMSQPDLISDNITTVYRIE